MSPQPLPSWPASNRLALKAVVALNLIVTVAGLMMMGRWEWSAAYAVAQSLWTVAAVPGILWLRADIIAYKGSCFFRWSLAGVALSAGMAALAMVVIADGDPWVLISLLLPAWMFAPIAMAAWLGARLVAARGQWVFVIGLVIFDLARLWAYWDVFRPHSGQSLAGLILIFLPVYQLPACAILLGVSWLLGRTARASLA